MYLEVFTHQVKPLESALVRYIALLWQLFLTLSFSRYSSEAVQTSVASSAMR